MANMVWTTAGLNWLKARAFDPDTTLDPALAIAIGSGSTAPSPDDTALVAETARVDLEFEDVGDGTFKLSATIPAGEGTGTVAEVGVFDDSADDAGTLLMRGLVSPFDKGAGDPYTVQIPASLEDLL